MAKTTAERVQAFRQRQAALIVTLRAEAAAAVRRADDAESALADARQEIRRLEAGGYPRCRRHGDELVCPACYRERGGDYDSA